MSCRPLALVALAALAFVLPLAGPAADAPAEGKKIALLVGVNDYDNRKLENLQYAERDMTELAKVLKDAGFGVRLLLGSASGDARATRKNLDAAFGEALKGVTKKDTILIALSGHGQQLFVEDRGPDGQTVRKEVPFFCPKDAVPADPATLFSLSTALRALDERGGGHNLLLVDACRNVVDPNRGARGGIDGSRVENLGEGTAVFFACSARQRARETNKAGGGHGVFFHFVLEGLRGAKRATNDKGQVTWERLVPYVKEHVRHEFPGWFEGLPEAERQRPHAIANLVDDPVLISAKAVIAENSFVSKATGMKFVRIRPGKFLMGSPKDEKDRSDDEEQHEVEITRPFALGVYAVTRGQFRKFVEDDSYRTEAEKDGKGGYGWDADKNEWKQDPKYTWRNPGFEQTDEHPVVEVSWNDAKAFCAWLGRKDGRTYRLPTEAEWEYACRARTTTRFHFGDDEEDLARFANLADASLRRATKKGWGIKADDGYAFTAPVGRFKANPWGLYDMHGNVWQWCEDYYGPYNVLNGRDPVRA
jgi:formylglycine-generating enzyme required for sulfatase activity